MSNKVHVAITRWDISDDYNRHTAAMMTSAMENCSVPIVFHIIHEEIVSFRNHSKAQEEMEKYKGLVSKYSSEVEFHNIILPEWMNKKNIPALNSFSPVGLYRFYLPNILPDLDKVISLGSDIIVKTDLLKLYEYNMGEYSIAGVSGSTLPFFVQTSNNKVRKYYQKINMPQDTYINADVLLFNLKKIRSENTLPGLALSYLRENLSLPLLEQDVLNVIYHGDILLLPKRYNITVTDGDEWVESILNESRQENSNNDYILHWAGSPKPWDFKTKSKYDHEYWSYLSKTPWGNSLSQIINYIPTSDEVIQDLDAYIWRYPLCQKVDLLFRLFVRLYKRYLDSFRH